jgi:1,4-dihydroxy-2-naphthoate octaprenyltransferase
MRMPYDGILNILRVIRLHIVIGGALAFLLGTLLAIVNGGSFHPLLFALTYLVVLCGDLSTHFGNDYFDAQMDSQAEKKFFSGSGLLVNNPSLRSLSKTLAIFLLASSVVLAAVATFILGGPMELMIITLVANFLGWFYSAPPLRLVSRGLGEVAIAFGTGFAIPGMGYLSAKGQIDPFFIYLSIPFMMYGFILSLSLEAPDRGIDLKGGKRNIIVRIGERAVFSLIPAIAILCTLSYLFYNWQIVSSSINLGLIALFSTVPLVAALFDFLEVFKGKKANLGFLGVLSLFLFNILMNSYLLLLVLT